MERRLPTVGGTSAGLGEPEAPLGKPMGLVLERLTVPDLQQNKDKCEKGELKISVMGQSCPAWH